MIAKGRLSPGKPIKETNVEEIGVWMSGMWPGSEVAAAATQHSEEVQIASQA